MFKIQFRYFMVECISKLCHRLLSQGWLNALAIYYTCYNLNILSIPPLTTHIALDTCHNRAVDDTCFNTQCACLSPRSSANTTTDCPTAKCNTAMLKAGDVHTQHIDTRSRSENNKADLGICVPTFSLVFMLRCTIRSERWKQTQSHLPKLTSVLH